MKTQTRYEEIILHEIRTLPLPVLPQALKILRSLRDGVLSVSKQQATVATTGFCGAWQDSRTLVTNNTKHFKRIKGLKLENWV